MGRNWGGLWSPIFSFGWYYINRCTSRNSRTWHWKQAILPYGLGGNIFPIYGEQSTDLVDGVFDFSFGNGIINEPGIALPVSCELIGFGLSTEGTSSNIVEVYKNGVVTGRRLNTNNTKKAYSNFITNPTQFVAEDVVNFLVVDDHSNSQAGIFVAWFRTTY